MFKKGDIIFHKEVSFCPVIYLGSSILPVSTTAHESSVILFCRDVPGIVHKDEAPWKIFIDVNNVQVYLIYTNLEKWLKMPMRKLNILIKKLQKGPVQAPPKVIKLQPKSLQSKGPTPLPRRAPRIPNPPAGPPVPGQTGGGRFAGWVE